MRHEGCLSELGIKMDEVLSHVIKMLEYIRSHPDTNTELEFRLGVFADEFKCGYSAEHRKVVTRLIKRFEANVAKLPNWTSTPQYVYILADYPQNIRQQCVPNQNNNSHYTIKTRIGKGDVVTDMPMDFRVALSSEDHIDIKPGHPMYLMVKKDQPEQVRYVQRATFTEVQEYAPGFTVCYQYDISKVSRQAEDKLSCTKTPCVYHCELELKTALKPLADKKEEQSQNTFVAEALLRRVRTLLGTHIQTPTGLRLIPEAKFHLLKNNV